MNKYYQLISFVCFVAIAYMLTTKSHNNDVASADAISNATTNSRNIASVNSTSEGIDYLRLAPETEKKYSVNGKLLSVLDDFALQSHISNPESDIKEELFYLKQGIRMREEQIRSNDDDKTLGCCDEIERLNDCTNVETKPFLYARHTLLICLDLAEKKGIGQQAFEVAKNFSASRSQNAARNAAHTICQAIKNSVQGEIISGREFYARAGSVPAPGSYASAKASIGALNSPAPKRASK